MPGHYDRFMELTHGGPYEPGSEIFKCQDCGAETHPGEGWDGAPDPGRCHRDCRRDHGDWKPGNTSKRYRANYDRIFPSAPGAGL